jgi:quercetin 2,3-dioxygenase
MERKTDRIEDPIELGASEQVQAKRLLLRENFARQSPFLRFSEDGFTAPGGFDAHPHRGMETVTLVLEGALHNRDHTGPELAHTLQLWLNLPAASKTVPARYVDQPFASVPVRPIPGGEVRVYAGASDDVRQPHGHHWPMMLLDIALEAGRRSEAELTADYRAFVYVLEGRAEIGKDRRRVRAPHVAWFEPTANPSAAGTIAFAAEEPSARSPLPAAH